MSSDVIASAAAAAAYFMQVIVGLIEDVSANRWLSRFDIQTHSTHKKWQTACVLPDCRGAREIRQSELPKHVANDSRRLYVLDSITPERRRIWKYSQWQIRERVIIALRSAAALWLMGIQSFA